MTEDMEMFPEIDVVIAWDDAEDGSASGGVVVTHREYGWHYENTNGATLMNWGSGDHPLENAAGLFAATLFDPEHPASRDAIVSWLREFSKIKECDWARKMLAAVQWVEDESKI